MAFKFYEKIDAQDLSSMDTGNVQAFLKDFAVSEDTEKQLQAVCLD